MVWRPVLSTTALDRSPATVAFIFSVSAVNEQMVGATLLALKLSSSNGCTVSPNSSFKRTYEHLQLEAMNFFSAPSSLPKYLPGGSGRSGVRDYSRDYRCCKPWHCSADWCPGEASQLRKHTAKETDRQAEDHTYHFDPDWRQVLLGLRGLLQTRLLGSERKISH